MKNIRTSLLVALALLTAFGADAEVRIRIRKQFLNFPISGNVEKCRISISDENGEVCTSYARLTAGTPDYWTFLDVSGWKGRTVTIGGDFPDEVLKNIRQTDEIMDSGTLYRESQRPQYHFTAKRGWINDPNGLMKYNGKYHMFFQHNPYENQWGNMHWGHAVSDDMLHWKELPLALHPDRLGTMFSGTAVMDYANDAGFNSPDGKPAMFAFYTADDKWETQCLAYSLDEGLTWTKYEGNPVIDSHEEWKTHDTRDPFVFRYEPGGYWVMVLNERDGNTIYNSTDLKEWTAMSHITGFWECPGLFELPERDNPGSRHWVMWGASGTYMIGDFDGKIFTPSSMKMCNLNGSAYAAQTYNNIPASDGRVIKMAWGRISFDGMPFNGIMLLPQEQILVRTGSELRLASRPVAEVDGIFEKVSESSDLSMEEANSILERFADDDLLRIKATVHMTYSTGFRLKFRGQNLVDYDLSHNLFNGSFYPGKEPGSMDLDIEVYVDRSVYEVYADDGLFSSSDRLNGRKQEGYVFEGREIRIERLEISRAKSVWE